MNRKILLVTRHGELWCRVDITRRDWPAVVASFTDAWPTASGYAYQLHEARESRRIVEVSGTGTRVLAIEEALQPMMLDDTGEPRHTGRAIAS